MPIKSITGALIVASAVIVAAAATGQQRGPSPGQSARATGAAGSPAGAAADRDRQRAADRLQDRDVTRDTDRTRGRDMLHLQDRDRLQDSDIFGSALMTAQEQARYHERLQSMSNEAQRQQFMAEHREQMQARARDNRIPLDELGD